MSPTPRMSPSPLQVGRLRITRVALLGALTCLLAAAPSQAASVEKTVAFELGSWVDLDLSDGPVTLHRMRLVKESGGFTKSKLFRPGNDEYLETVQLQVEFSNSSSRDWESSLDIRWLDAKGEAIDGYRDSENLDSSERRDLVTVTLSTLRYGLDKAKKLHLEIDVHPD